MSASFQDSIQRALAHKTLAAALGNFSESYRVSRAKAYEGIDFEALRTRIAGIKAEAAANLDRLAAQFAQQAEARGARVFRATRPEEVLAHIRTVAQERGVTSVVKSKSMATEEIHLNAHLREAGIAVHETDLGEWIVQLAGQTPSHMVLPAIHLTKEEVAGLFSRETGEALAPEIPRLVEVARRELRPKFLAAEMGISGANIAVAETGSLVLLTNEGNARLVTTLPRIHIAVVGVEKLVGTFAEIVPILQALPRSATGQLLTSYVSVITGATPQDDGAPKELHIVLLDNRRTEMAADPQFKEALQCIRCASCLNVCPVYRLVGGHVFGKVYTGGIGTILTAWFDALRQADDIQGLCIQCGNCKEVCPGKIDLPALILEIRRRLVLAHGVPFLQNAIYAVVGNRRLFHAMLRAASVADRPLATRGLIRHLPLFLSKLTDGRSLPAIAPQPFRDVFRKLRQPPGRQKAILYAGCLIDFVYPEMGESLVRLLNRAGIEVLFPEGQTCCGAPARYSGAYEAAARNARDNVAALLAEEADFVISACPTCTVALREEFIRSFSSPGQEAWLEQARRLADKTVDCSTLLQRLADEGRLPFQSGGNPGTVTYHDSCHLKRTLHAEAAPRALLRAAGYELTEMAECDSCCGMGGSYAIKLPEISTHILGRKLRHIKATGAAIAAMDCPGCVLQIRGGIDQDGAPVQVRHTAELLAARLAPEAPAPESASPLR